MFNGHLHLTALLPARRLGKLCLPRQRWGTFQDTSHQRGGYDENSTTSRAIAEKATLRISRVG